MEEIEKELDIKDDEFSISDNEIRPLSSSAFTVVEPSTRSSPASSPSVWYSSLLTSLYNSRYREHNNNTEEDDHNNSYMKEDTNTSKEENSSGKFSLASTHNRKYEGHI